MYCLFCWYFDLWVIDFWEIDEGQVIWCWRLCFECG